MKRAFLALALVGALSCSDSSGPNAMGSLTFTYTGGGGGTFNASGNAPSLIAPPTGTSWAAGFVDGGEINVGASSPRSGVLVDLALLRVERTSPGSQSIDAICNIDGDTPCTGMTLYLNFNGNGDTADFFCGLTSGTIVLMEVSGSRVRGTVSGTGSCIAGAGGAITAFAVSNGSFDVALVAAPF